MATLCSVSLFMDSNVAFGIGACCLFPKHCPPRLKGGSGSIERERKNSIDCETRVDSHARRIRHKVAIPPDGGELLFAMMYCQAEWRSQLLCVMSIFTEECRVLSAKQTLSQEEEVVKNTRQRKGGTKARGVKATWLN